jgi:cystathionine beta-lyase/cystathionine gamma-synthase
MKRRNMKLGFATRAIHTGYDPAEAEGALTPPVHLISTYMLRHLPLDDFSLRKICKASAQYECG